MPELTWLGKDAIRHHHLEVPYRPFVPTATFEAPGTAADAPLHRIIHGDNLDALKSLLPEFEGRVKCIYIDPPYNTGNEQWAYNDNVNDPRLLAWLGRTVGKEAEDLTRHDKWLCMMYPRLQLLHKLLSEDGAIFISIDDNEVGNLRCVMDEIFGAKNMLACFAWKTDGNFDNQAKIKINHEYILAFCKKATRFAAPQVIDPATASDSKLFNQEIKNTLIKNGVKNPVTAVTLPVGFPTNFEKGSLGKRGTEWPKYTGEILADDFKLTQAVVAESGWSSADILAEFIKNGFDPVPDAKGNATTIYMTQTGALEAAKPRANTSHVISSLSGLGSTQSMSVELQKMGLTFSYPKPVGLVEYLVSMTDPDSIVLDSFAGSGTTLHAVAKLNARDGGRRRCLLIEVEAYADTLTAERARRVLAGYGAVPGLGGRFEFGELGGPLFDAATGLLDPAAPLPALRQYVWWQETGTQLPPAPAAPPPDHPAYLGTAADGARIYFDYHPARPSALTTDWLGGLTVPAPRFVVYADSCEVNADWLALHHVVYKKIPRDLARL